jgi:spore germination protein YaaH
MDRGIADHLADTDLTTLGLFSVTNTSKGNIDTRQNGYRRITGSVGKEMIRVARRRDMRVELVFTSFGLDRNTAFFENRKLQDATIGSLVGLATRLRLDGINADVELLDPTSVFAYGEFIRRLRDAVVTADPDDQVSVASTANISGSAMAIAAARAGADRIFMMGYDYHWPGSTPGASSPMERRDGDEKDLVWSLDLYEAAGVPVDRTILGLPLYGMTWPVSGPDIGAPQTGRGEAWIPRRHLDVLRDDSIEPLRDEIEIVEFYAFAANGTPASAVPSPSPSASADAREWRAVYVDSPATLAPKLALANERGLAGAGFWAIGYERGLPGYSRLIARFAAGESME